MVDPSQMRADVTKIIQDVGQSISILQWSGADLVFDSGSYDVARYPNASGIGFSGLGVIQPINNTAGADHKFREQGRVYEDSVKIYMHGSIAINNTAFITDSNSNVYQVAEDGIVPHRVSGTVIYQTVYCNRSGTDFGRF